MLVEEANLFPFHMTGIGLIKLCKKPIYTLSCIIGGC
jgi:hypothetical protein